MMSQESQPRASISSADIGRNGAGVSRLAQKGLYEKISRGSAADGGAGSFEEAGTTPPLTDSEVQVKGRFLGRFWGLGRQKRRTPGLPPGRTTRHGACNTPSGWPGRPSPKLGVMHDDDDRSPGPEEGGPDPRAGAQGRSVSTGPRDRTGRDRSAL